MFSALEDHKSVTDNCLENESQPRSTGPSWDC